MSRLAQVGTGGLQVRRVLVVDDEPGILELLVVTLEDNFDVLTATNGREALEVVTEGAVDAVVLDVMMPEVDGFEALRRIRLDDSIADVPVVMLTARVAEDDYMHGFSYGADAYVSKPFDPDELIKTLIDVLGRTPEQRRAFRDEERSKAALLRQLERRFE